MAFALLIAYVFAQLAENRSTFTLAGKKVFTSTVNEELLFLLAAVLLTFVLTSESPTVIPNGYSNEEAIFQPDLGIITVALFAARVSLFFRNAYIS